MGIPYVGKGEYEGVKLTRLKKEYCEVKFHLLAQNGNAAAPIDVPLYYT